MSKSLNKVTLLGHVGNEPDVRTTAGGKKVAKFSLATSRVWNDRNGQAQEQTQWHRLTAWDKLAQLVEQFVNKGDRLYIEGSIEYSTTEDENGKPRYWTDIVVRELVMLGSGNGSHGQRDTRSTAARDPFDHDDSELPF